MSADKILKSMKSAPKLDQLSYNRWSTHFRDVLSLYDVESFLYDEKKELLTRDLPNPSESDLIVHKQDKNIRVAMSQLVPDTAFHLVGQNFTSRECWKNLQEFYCPDPSGDLDDLLQEFWSFTVEDDIYIDEFVQKLSHIRGRIDAIDSKSKPTDTNVKKRILAHFMSCCNGFYMSVSIPLKDPSVSLQATVSAIRASQVVYQDLHPTSFTALAKGKSSNEPATNSLNSPSGQSLEKTCAYCRKRNHLRESCFLWLDTPDGSKWAAKHPEKAAKTRKLQERIQNRNGKGRKRNPKEKSITKPKSEDGQHGSAWMIQKRALYFNQKKCDHDVVLDTGASNHIFCDESMFVSLVASNNSVVTASGARIPVVGIGSAKFKIFDDSGKQSKFIEVENVWFVPSCSKNLISGIQLLAKGFKISSTKKGLGVFSANGNLVATARPRGGLFCFNSASQSIKSTLGSTLISEETKKSVSRLIHNRFAHVGSHLLERIPASDINYTLSNENLSDFSLDKSSLSSCDICNTCKQVENINRGPVTKSEKLLQLVHSDVWGRCRVPGILGSNYFITFTDDYSRESEVCLMKSTKEVPFYFQWYKSKKELQSGENIRAMRFDGGSEYKKIKFDGIAQQISAPYTQHQNGVSERLNRTLVTMARCMLAHARLPLRFWDAAIQTACYLRNRLPHLPDKRTPFEAMNGIAPCLSNIKVWGCVCYVLIQVNNPHRYKLSPTSLKGIFVGYCQSSTQYRVYVPSKSGRSKIVTSANVKFQEDSFWKWGMSSKEQPSELEYQSENILSPAISDISDSYSSESDSGPSSALLPAPPLSLPSVSNELTHEHGDNLSDIAQSDSEEAPGPTSPSNNLSPEVSTLRRSSRVPKPIEPRSAWQPTNRTMYIGADVPIPQSYSEAISGSHKVEWLAAINDELNSLKEKKVFTPVTHVPHERKPIGCRWIFNIKSDGRFKARLVAKGFSQVYGIDYLDTYSPTLRADSLRILLAVAAYRDWEIHQVDVKTAYLEGELDEEIFMRSPEGLNETKYVRINKALYGLKQSGRAWNKKLHEKLISLNFAMSVCDSCIYLHLQKQIIIGAYVDDLIICGKLIQEVLEIKKQISSYFEIKDLGLIDTVIGWKIIRDRSTRTLKIEQSEYILDKIKSFGQQDANDYGSPLDGYAGILPRLQDEALADESAYASAIGSLGYASISTRPDITFPTTQLASFNSSPTKRHWNTVCRVLRYLKGTHEYCLSYSFGPKSQELNQDDKLTIFSDSDFASDVTTRRSVSGYIFMLGGGPICWQSKRQKSVSTSTAEAEYVALFEAAKQAVWVKRLLEELHISTQLTENEGILTFTDNQSAIAISKGTNSAKTKHIDIAYHFVRESLENNTIYLKYIPTGMMLADILTKPLTQTKAKPLCQQIFGEK